MHINIRHNTAAEGIVLQIIDHPVHLIHHPLFVLMLHTHLITVSLANRTTLVCPFIPDMAVQIIHIVGFALPYPQHFVSRALKSRPAQCHDRKLPRQIIPVYYPEFLYRISRNPVSPVRSHLLPLRARPVFQNIPAHMNKNMICCTHLPDSFSFPLYLYEIPPALPWPLQEHTLCIPADTTVYYASVTPRTHLHILADTTVYSTSANPRMRPLHSRRHDLVILRYRTLVS